MNVCNYDQDLWIGCTQCKAHLRNQVHRLHAGMSHAWMVGVWSLLLIACGYIYIYMLFDTAGMHHQFPFDRIMLNCLSLRDSMAYHADIHFIIFTYAGILSCMQSHAYKSSWLVTWVLMDGSLSVPICSLPVST